MGVKRVVDYAVKVRIQPDKAGTAVQSSLCTAVYREERLLKLPVVSMSTKYLE